MEETSMVWQLIYLWSIGIFSGRRVIFAAIWDYYGYNLFFECTGRFYNVLHLESIQKCQYMKLAR